MKEKNEEKNDLLVFELRKQHRIRQEEAKQRIANDEESLAALEEFKGMSEEEEESEDDSLLIDSGVFGEKRGEGEEERREKKETLFEGGLDPTTIIVS